MVEVTMPSALTPELGDALMVELEADAEPARNATVEVTELRPAGEAILRVLVAATVEAIVPLVWPEPFVALAGCTKEFPVPVEVKVALVPEIKLLKASRRVIVTTVVVVPSAKTLVLGEAPIVELAAEGAPAVNVSVVVTVPRPAGAEIPRVFTSAIVLFMAPVVWPEALVAEPG